MLKDKFLVHFGSKLLISILATIAGIFVARIAGPEVMGTIAYATAYVSIFGFITGLFGTGHIKLISEGKDIGKCMGTYTPLMLGSYGVYFIIVLGYFLVQNIVLHKEYDTPNQEIVIILVLFVTVLGKLLEINETSFTAQLKQAKSNLPGLLKSILFQSGRIIVVLLGFKAIGLASWNLVSTIIVLPIAYKLFKSLPYEGFDKSLAKRYFAIALPIFLIVLINSLSAHSGKLLLSNFSNTTELGYYAAANVIGGKVLLLGNSIGMIFFPFFSKMIEKNNWEEVNKKISSFQAFIATFIFPVICLLALISQPLIISILGEKYQPSVLPFSLLMLASFFSVVGMPYGNIISGMGKFYVTMWLRVIYFVIYMASLFVFLSPNYGGLGATGLALSLLSVNVAYNVIIIIMAGKVGKLQKNVKIPLQYIIIIGLSTITYYVIKDSEFSNTPLWWIIIIPMYFIFIYFVLYILGFIKKKQIKQLVEVTKIRRLMSYFKSEIKER